jgi:hypothetical protein
MACRHHPRNGREGEHAHKDDYSIVCKAPISHERTCEGDLHHLLISGAVTVWKDGKTRSTMIKVTHATAMMPMGMYHFPRVNVPGTSLFRPEVIRRRMGVAYDM